VECLVFALDGKTLAAGDRDGQVKLWDPTTGQEKVAFFPAAGPVLRVAFAQDPSALAAVSERGAIHSWRAATAVDVVRYAERTAAAAVGDALPGSGSADPP
jgi:WD40 repeat protein